MGESRTWVGKRKRPEEPISQYNAICARCSPIVDKIVHLITIMKDRKSTWIANLGSSDTWVEATCNLCNLFSSVRPDSQSSRRYVLRVLHSLALFPNIPNCNASIYLRDQRQQFFAVVPSGSQTVSHDWGKSGYIATIPRNFLPETELYGRLVPEQISYPQLRNWISYCKDKHTCEFKTSHHLPLFRVIDCQSHRIIVAPHACSYVALSYVWGPPKPEEASLRNPEVELPPNIPNVIREAMAVTLGLNERYLWVDKYCIDKSNPQAEKEQIQNMGLIYEGAQVTVFAASGHDDNFGLPGVTVVARKLQSSGLIEGVLFASTLSNPLDLVNNSTLSTRGWTYQEVVLSKRRLFFTEEQVYFMCNGMDCFESIHRPLDKLHQADGKRFPGPGMQFMPYGRRPRRRFSEFMDHIENFSGRNLSLETDSLNAFAGILRTFERVSPPINNFYGLPIVSGTALQSFTHSLTWIHHHDHNKPGSIMRRSGFPSFSFAGWKKKASLPSRVELNKSRVEDFDVADIDIQVATENGRLYQLEDIQELKRSQAISKSSAHLQICARVLENNLWKKTNLPREGSCVTGASSAGFEIIMCTTTGESINCRAELSGMIGEDEFLQKLQAGELKCLLLGFTHQTFRQFLMIVERDLEGTVRRVGIMSVILPIQDMNLFALSKDKHLFCFE
jgi:hypothetical protein